MGQPFRVTRATPHRGFTLIEILVVLVIFAVLITMASALTRGVSAAQKRSLTTTRMAAIDAALVQFVMQSRRLPCPADGTIATGLPNAGVEARALGVCTLVNQANGVVPWVTLGLPEADATDGWDRRLTYRTQAALVADGVMDMSWCDPAGTIAGPPFGVACNTACTSATLGNCTPPSVFLSGRGIRIQNVVGGALMDPSPAPPPGSPTGAAYVVISHGESGGGGYLNSGQVSTSTTTDGTEEQQQNYANLALRAYYVDDGVTDIAGPNHFDDILSRPSVLSVITKAALAPRPH